MTEAKLVQVVYLVLLSLLAYSFNIELAAADDKSDNNVGSGEEDGGENWLRGAHGRRAGWFHAMGGGIGGSIGGGLGPNGVAVGSVGGGIPGVHIGGGIGVTGSGTNKADCGHSGNGGGSGAGYGRGGGVGVGAGTGGGYGDSGVGVGTGSGGGSGTGASNGGGSGYGGGPGSGAGTGGSGSWMMVPEWLGQPMFCTPMRCQGGGACGGIEVLLGLQFISYNLSANQTNTNAAAQQINSRDDGIPNGTYGKNEASDDHQQRQQVPSTGPPKSG